MSGSRSGSLDGSGLSARIHHFTNESVLECYQCGKCSAGCPLARDMDFPPSYLLRMLQLGMPVLDEQVLASLSIWLCLTCEACVARCPKEVGLPRIMDFLRQESLKLGKVNPKAKEILAFHRSFLDSVRRTGRLHEVGLIARYKMRTLHLLQDVLAAPKMMARGKLRLMPPRGAGKSDVRKIFHRTSAADPTVAQPLSSSDPQRCKEEQS